jgi:Putative peptidoglycan binding domain
VPRKKSSEDETPRRRRAAAVAAEPEHGLLLRVLLHSPKDAVAGLIAFAACSAIITNALFLQSGPHPAPMFGSGATPPAALAMPSSLPNSTSSPLPRPRPAEADEPPVEPRFPEPRLSEPRLVDPRPVEPKPVEQRLAEQRLVEPRPVEPRPVEQKPSDPLANLVKATASAPAPQANVLRPPAPIPNPVAITGSRRVAAVQRALTDYGYGQLKPTGIIGQDTRLAIERFEHERRLPVTGQVTDRLVRELSVVIGHAVE